MSQVLDADWWRSHWNRKHTGLIGSVCYFKFAWSPGGVLTNIPQHWLLRIEKRLFFEQDDDYIHVFTYATELSRNIRHKVLLADICLPVGRCLEHYTPETRWERWRRLAWQKFKEIAES